MKKYFIFIFSFLIILTDSLAFAVSPMEAEHAGHKHEGPAGRDATLSGKVEEGVRVIEVKASRYKFDPDPIVVNFGEKVRLIVTSTDVAHGLEIPDFNVNVSVSAGKTESIEFIVDKKGTFHAHCSVYCGPGHSHMHADFIVK